MFFSISKSPNDNFTEAHALGSIYVSVDSGWTLIKRDSMTLLWKGYCDTHPMNQVLDQIVDSAEPTLMGNFCVIAHDHRDGITRIRSDLYRGFPIYVDCSEITNLRPLRETIWSDSVIDLDQDLAVTEHKFDLVGSIDTDPVTAQHAKEFIADRLHAKTQAFVSHNQLPIKAHLSGGVDSMLVFSFLQQHTDRYEIVKCRHIEYDRFWLLNQSHITRYWAYTQIHHWKQPCVLTSGAPGDEFMLRSPTTGDMFLKYHNKDALSLMEQDPWKNCLHKDYFSRPKHMKIFETQEIDASMDKKKFSWNLCNINANDWQHWHIGHTLTWTPLRDLEIFKMMLRMPLFDCIGQFLDSQISRQLIRDNSPDLDLLISDKKNFQNPMKNLVDFLDKYPG